MNARPASLAKFAFLMGLLILSAYMSFTIPISETGIPFTLQSLIVFVLAAFMTPLQSMIFFMLYLGLGVAGLPVFADGTSGFDKICGNSGGFLYGFVLSGVLISFMISRMPGPNFQGLLKVFLLATIVLFIAGLTHLAVLIGWDNAIRYGLHPFWKMALLKAFLASGIVYLVIKSDLCARSNKFL